MARRHQLLMLKLNLGDRRGSNSDNVFLVLFEQKEEQLGRNKYNYIFGRTIQSHFSLGEYLPSGVFSKTMFTFLKQTLPHLYYRKKIYFAKKHISCIIENSGRNI